jgi:hypothetical protein
MTLEEARRQYHYLCDYYGIYESEEGFEEWKSRQTFEIENN